MKYFVYPFDIFQIPADVAQPEEQPICSGKVAGSTPAVGSTKPQRWRLKPQLYIESTGEPEHGEVEFAWPDGLLAWVSAERFAYRFEPVPDVPETCVWQTVSILPTYLAPSCRPKDDIHRYVARGFTFCPWCTKPIEVRECEGMSENHCDCLCSGCRATHAAELHHDSSAQILNMLQLRSGRLLTLTEGEVIELYPLLRELFNR